MNNYYLITFKSITYAMQFEKIMKTNNVEIKLIPVPRSISASCGMCGKFEENQKENVIELCNDNNIIYEKIFEMNI